MIPSTEAAAWAAEVADDFAATMHSRDPGLGLDGTPPSLFTLDDMVNGAGEVDNWERLVMPATAAYFGEVAGCGSRRRWCASRWTRWRRGSRTDQRTTWSRSTWPR